MLMKRRYDISPEGDRYKHIDKMDIKSMSFFRVIAAKNLNVQ